MRDRFNRIAGRAIAVFGAIVQGGASCYRFLSFGATRTAFKNYWCELKPVLWNMFSSDVYTFASAISTTAILSFFPFTILIISFVRHVWKSDAAYGVITGLLREYLPYQQDFITSSIQTMTDQFGSVQFISVIILLASATGVFVPIEVTLNRTWHAPANMSFIKNQIVSFGLVLLCGAVALLSFYVGGLNVSIVRFLFGWFPFKAVQDFLIYVILKFVGFSLSMSVFFLVYYLLPTVRLSLDKTIRASVFTGVCWELGKYLYMGVLPLFDLGAIYGPFTVAVALILWSYVSAMILILGADLAHHGLLSIEPFRAAYGHWKREERRRSQPDGETEALYDLGSLS